MDVEEDRTEGRKVDERKVAHPRPPSPHRRKRRARVQRTLFVVTTTPVSLTRRGSSCGFGLRWNIHIGFRIVHAPLPEKLRRENARFGPTQGKRNLIASFASKRPVTTSSINYREKRFHSDGDRELRTSICLFL